MIDMASWSWKSATFKGFTPNAADRHTAAKELLESSESEQMQHKTIAHKSSGG
jgi:hypothetical protein